MKHSLIFVIFLTGCGGVGIGNDQIISEVQKCRNAGMSYILHQNFNVEITRVSCYYGKNNNHDN